MPLTYPTFQDYVELARAELRRQIPTVDPTLAGSWARGFNDGSAAMATALGLVIRDLERQLFPQTAQGEFLRRWGAYESLEPTAATGATGAVSIVGTAGTLVNAGVVLRSAAGRLYETTVISSVQEVTQTITSLTRVGNTVTASLSNNHNLATGISVTVQGAVETDYNGTFVIAVTAANQFQYTISSQPSSPATGTISYSSTFASVDIRASDTGTETNLDAGASLTVEETIAGLPGPALVQFNGLSGGASLEDDEDFRNRILLSRASIQGVFTRAQVRLAALGVAGNTRVFVPEVTNSISNAPPTPGTAPAPGQTIVYVLRDNDDNIIPSQSILDATKTAVLTNGRQPAFMSAEDVFVFAPTLVTQNFSFSAISPDTPTMRTAINTQLEAFFRDQVLFETTVNRNSYTAAIQNTQDASTGDLLQSFTLTSPTGDITVSSGQIAALGTVTFT